MAEFASDNKGQPRIVYFKERLLNTFDYLLRNSRSVATTSVLVSVATAYPELLADKIIPLFKVKEFYKWDLERCHHEHNALAPLGSSALGGLLQKERYESNNLPHRKEHLEMLFLKLSFGHLAGTLIRILDNFYSEAPQETNWKFSLNRMDKRKLEVVKQQGNDLLVQTKIDEELLPQAQAVQKEVEAIAPLNQGLLWARNKLENKIVENGTIGQWRIHYLNILTSKLSGDQARLYLQPTVIAAVAVKDFFSELSVEESAWCMKKIFEVVNYEIKRSFNHYDMGLNSPYGPFESGPAFGALADIATKGTADEKAIAKELIFVSLIYLHNKLDRDLLVARFKSDIWNNAPDFAMACIAGLIEYSRITDLRTRLHLSSHWLQEDPNERALNVFKKGIKFLSEVFKSVRSGGKYKNKKSRLKERDKWIAKYDNGLTKIINDVVQNKHQIIFQQLGINDLPAYLLFEAISLTLPDTTIPAVHQFVSLIIGYIRQNIDKSGNFNNAKIDYQLLQNFEKYIASYLLRQPLEIATEKFKELLTIIAIESEEKYFKHKQKDFLERCLDELISQVIKDTSLSGNFWLLWELLSKEFQQGKVPFHEKLLLDYPYWNSDLKEWAPLENKMNFYSPIIPHLIKFKPLVKLLSGVGFTALMPGGLLWLSGALETIDFEEKYFTYFTEKLAINIFYDEEIRTIIRNNAQLREAFILILDKLIDESSSPAFLIRESFISLN